MKTDILVAAIEARAVRDTLALLVKGQTPAEVGRRALLTAWLVSPDLVGKTQRDLACRLGVSPPRVTQMLNVLRQKSSPRTLSR